MKGGLQVVVDERGRSSKAGKALAGGKVHHGARSKNGATVAAYSGRKFRDRSGD